jgi:hypothetical protein
MVDAIIAFIDFLYFWITTRRGLFWLVLLVIAIGLLALIANLFEPGRPSFRG